MVLYPSGPNFAHRIVLTPLQLAMLAGDKKMSWLVRYKQHGVVKYLENSAVAGSRISIVGTIVPSAAARFDNMAAAKSVRDMLIDPMLDLKPVVLIREA